MSRRKSNVPHAGNSEIMSEAIPTPTRKRKSAPKYPLYEERELRVIIRFLSAYLTEFQMALEKEKMIAGEDQGKEPFRSRIRYRDHQVTTVRELVKRAFWPQRHLVLVSEEEITEMVKQCLQA